MEDADIAINLSGLAIYGNWPSVLSDSIELGQFANPSAIQDAIAALYEVLNGFNQKATPQAPDNLL